MKEIIQFRRTSWELIQLAHLLGSSRELSLAVTAIQSGRMRLGSVALEMGSENPYPQADNPASPEIRPTADVPEISMDWPQILEAGAAAGGPFANVKYARGAVQDLINDMALYRRTKWARPYGTLGEVLYDLALADMIQAKQWLGEQLAVLNGKPVVKPAARASVGAQVAKLIAGADTRDLAEIVNALRGVLEDVAGGGNQVDAPLPLDLAPGAPTADGTDATDGADGANAPAPALPHLSLGAPQVVSLAEATPAAALEAGVVKVLSTSAPGAAVVTPELAELARAAVDDTIRTHLEANMPVMEICRVLDVTEHRVNKIKKALAAEKAEPPAHMVKAGARGARIAKELAAEKPAAAPAAQPETT